MCRKATTRQRPRFYRVMLHNDDFNRREYVVKVLLKVLDNFTMEDAINCMQVRATTFLIVLKESDNESSFTILIKQNLMMYTDHCNVALL